MKKIFISLICLSILVGCARPIVIDTVENPTPVIHPSDPRPMELNNLNWMIVTNENVHMILNNPNMVIFALDSTNYQLYMMNLQELLRYLEQQREIILYYRK